MRKKVMRSLSAGIVFLGALGGAFVLVWLGWFDAYIILILLPVAAVIDHLIGRRLSEGGRDGDEDPTGAGGSGKGLR